MKPIKSLFHRTPGRKYTHRDSVMRRLSLATDRIIKATAAEYHLSYIGAADLVSEKAVIKMVEERGDQGLTSRQRQVEILRTVAEVATKYTIEHQGATPSKKPPGGTPGAAAPGKTPPPQP